MLWAMQPGIAVTDYNSVRATWQTG